MARVQEELASLHSSPGPDTVHDLRVALRRCRSLAATMEEVDPDPAWPRLRKLARRPFRALGALRNVHVLQDWVQKLGPENDPLKARLLASLKADEKQLSQAALRMAAKFDSREWTHLEHHLRKRARLVPGGGLAAECLALERFEEAKELHNRALRTEKPKPWHALRVGLKRFRYTVEALLPEHYAAWCENLKRFQDLLGDVHDLDVLSALLENMDPSEASGSEKIWQEKISLERHERIETYRRLTLGRTSLWHEWRHNLPHGRRLDAAASARLRAAARAAGSRSRRTAQVARLALRIFDLLRRAHAAPVFRAADLPRMMEAAARLHGIVSVADRRLSPKALRKHLLAWTLPPNWSSDEWNLMAWAVRFHRGPEPKPKNGFAKLSEEEQAVVRALAGVLRLARALRKCGVESPVGLRIESSTDSVVLRIPGLADTADVAARLAAAKHLLETVLEMPLILKAVPKPEKPASPIEKVSKPPLVAAASA